MLAHPPKLQLLTHNTAPKARPSTRSVMAALESIADVTETISPNQRGRVHYQGSWWFAVCLEPIEILPGKRVRVIERDNITLIVEPLTNA
jgi:membrane protein implicated in regulation of membrane protease activity